MMDKSKIEHYGDELYNALVTRTPVGQSVAVPLTVIESNDPPDTPIASGGSSVMLHTMIRLLPVVPRSRGRSQRPHMR